MSCQINFEKRERRDKNSNIGNKKAITHITDIKSIIRELYGN